MMHEAPKHNLSGLMEAGVVVPEKFIRQCVVDVVRSVAKLHEEGYVHRQLALNHIFVFGDRAKLGGLSMARPCTTDSRSAMPGYKMNENDLEEHRHGYSLIFAPPEVLMGAKLFTTASDMWSLGCLIAMMLLRRPLFRGADVSAHFECILRICGVPPHDIEEKWPRYEDARPEKAYHGKLRKMLKGKYNDLDEDVLEVLESLLQIDPRKRLNARAVLELPYFTKVQYQCVATRGKKEYDEEPSHFTDRCTIAQSLRNHAVKASPI